MTPKLNRISFSLTEAAIRLNLPALIVAVVVCVLPIWPHRTASASAKNISLVRAGVSKSLHHVNSNVGRRTNSSLFEGVVFPVYMSLSTFALIGGVDNVPVNIEVNQIPSGGGTIQIGCDHPEVVVSPSGSWPYRYTFAAGSSTTHSFSFATRSVSNGVTVQIYSAEDGVSLSNSANWRTCGTVMIGADM